jgi:hypothetical protein
MCAMFGERQGAVRCRPATQIDPVELGASDCQDVADILSILRPVSVPRPAQLRHDHVFGRCHERVAIQHPHTKPPRESLLVVRIVTANEQLADERTVHQGDDVSCGAGDRFKGTLNVQGQAGGQSASEALETTLIQLDDEVGVARRSRNAVEVRRERADDHVRHAGGVERTEHGDDRFVRCHWRSSARSRANRASINCRTPSSSSSGC